MTTVADLTERDLIARIRTRLAPAPPWVAVGIGDDAAVVEPERNRLDVLTVDALVEGVHFERAFTPPSAIGHRGLAVNLSDIAAMGAQPRLALLSLALPESLPCADFDAIVSSLSALAVAHGVHVIGGNLTRSPGPLVVDVTVMGTVKKRCVLTRAGARPGDEIYVTGAIGSARAGLQYLKTRPSAISPEMESPVARFLYPEPRLRTGILLGRNRAATACMDLSDGLTDGVRQLAEASGVGATLNRSALPIDPEARAWFASRGTDPTREAVAGGDDYELIFTVSPRQRRKMLETTRGGPPVTLIGVCTPERELRLTGPIDGRVIDEPLPEGFTHFKPDGLD